MIIVPDVVVLVFGKVTKVSVPSRIFSLASCQGHCPTCFFHLPKPLSQFFPTGFRMLFWNTNHLQIWKNVPNAPDIFVTQFGAKGVFGSHSGRKTKNPSGKTKHPGKGKHQTLQSGQISIIPKPDFGEVPLLNHHLG